MQLPDELERFEEYACHLRWRKSKTYKPPFDHEYIILKDDPEAFRFMKGVIEAYGFDLKFMGKYETRYLVVNGYRYWAYETVLNRDIDAKWKGGFPSRASKKSVRQITLFRSDDEGVFGDV